MVQIQGGIPILTISKSDSLGLFVVESALWCFFRGAGSLLSSNSDSSVRMVAAVGGRWDSGLKALGYR